MKTIYNECLGNTELIYTAFSEEDKEDDEKMRRRINDIQLVTETKYAIFPTLITTFGLVDNSYSGDIQSLITMDDLFSNI